VMHGRRTNVDYLLRCAAHDRVEISQLITPQVLAIAVAAGNRDILDALLALLRGFDLELAVKIESAANPVLANALEVLQPECPATEYVDSLCRAAFVSGHVQAFAWIHNRVVLPERLAREIYCDAIGCGHEQLIRFLIEVFDPCRRIAMQFLPLAIESAISPSLLSVYLERYRIFDSSLHSVLLESMHTAALTGQVESARLLILYCIKLGHIRSDQRSLLEQAVAVALQDGCVWLVSVAYELDPRFYRDDTALILAAKFGQTRVVSLLLSRGADIHTQHEEALRCATRNGHSETVALLLSRGARGDAAIIQRGCGCKLLQT